MAYSWNNTFALSKVPVGTSGKCPCKGCTDRNARCHSGCKKYAAWSDEMNKAKNVASKVARADKDFKDVSFADAPLRIKKTYLKSGRSAVGRKV